MKMDLKLDLGGITSPAFEDNLELWDSLIADFSDFVAVDSGAAETETAPEKGPSQDL